MNRLLIAAFAVFTASSAAADCVPKNVLKIVTAFEGGGVKAGTFAAAPRTLYRSGATLGRMEETANPETGLHLLIIVNGADVWMVNRNDSTGQHAIDPGPIGFHAPLIGDVQSKHWNQFELGCEVPFMKAVGAAVSETTAGTIYEHSREGVTARLLVGKSGVPARVDFSGRGEDFSIVYKSFEELADPPKDLFAKPAGVRFVEQGN